MMIRIEFERRKKKMTQKELGKELGISASEICRIEQGNRPFPAHIKRLSEYFGIPEDELLKEV